MLKYLPTDYLYQILHSLRKTLHRESNSLQWADFSLFWRFISTTIKKFSSFLLLCLRVFETKLMNVFFSTSKFGNFQRSKLDCNLSIIISIIWFLQCRRNISNINFFVNWCLRCAGASSNLVFKIIFKLIMLIYLVSANNLSPSI